MLALKAVMRREYFNATFLAALLLVSSLAQAQNTQPAPAPGAQQAQTPASQPRQAGFDLSEYGVRIQPEPRLIVMMAALDAAGFDPTPQGQEPSAFRAQLRRDQAGLDEDLRKRLSNFYRSNKLPGQATAAEQASRYISLAYAVGPAPDFEAPARSIDLPTGLLDVLDFAALVREFYKKSGIAERLPA